MILLYASKVSHKKIATIIFCQKRNIKNIHLKHFTPPYLKRKLHHNQIRDIIDKINVDINFRKKQLSYFTLKSSNKSIEYFRNIFYVQQ